MDRHALWLPDEGRAAAQESVPETEASLRLRVRFRFLRLRGNTGGRCAIVDLLVL